MDSESTQQKNLNKKLIICVRHGQRSDHVGLTPVLHINDPELTETGKQQAFEIGKMLKNKINEKYKLDKGKKILIVSSPFARTIQTSKQIMAGFEGAENVDKKIHIDHLLSEHIDYKFEGRWPKDFLSLYTRNSEFFEEEIKGIDFEFLNEKDLLPSLFEEEKDVYTRLNKLVECAVEKVLSREDVGAVVFVSHASPLDQLNKVLGHPGPYGWQLINYCSSFLYSYDLEGKTPMYMERLDVVVESNK